MKYTLIIIAALTVAVAGYARQVPELAGNVQIIEPSDSPAVQEAIDAGIIDPIHKHRIAMLPVQTAPHAVMYTGVVTLAEEGEDDPLAAEITQVIDAINALQGERAALLERAPELRDQLRAILEREEAKVEKLRAAVVMGEAIIAANTPAQPD